MKFIFELNKNYYCLDGVALSTIYLERIVIDNGSIHYTEDYQSISTWQFAKSLFSQLLGAYKKQRELSTWL